jgi:hypothetical protein
MFERYTEKARRVIFFARHLTFRPSISSWDSSEKTRRSHSRRRVFATRAFAV